MGRKCEGGENGCRLILSRLGGVKRGVVAAYCREPARKLLVISDPYDYGGQMVVTARTCERNKSKRQFGLYAIDALVPFAGKEKG